MKYTDNPVDTIYPLTLTKRFGPIDMTRKRWVARTCFRHKDIAAEGTCPRDAAYNLGKKMDHIVEAAALLAFGTLIDLAVPPPPPQVPGTPNQSVGGLDANATD